MNVKQFLLDLGFTEEQATQMAPNFQAGHISQLQARTMDPVARKKFEDDSAALEKARTDLAVANERFNQEIADWGQMTATEKASSTKLQADLERSQQDIFRLTQHVTRLAGQVGVDPKTLIGETPVAPPKTEPIVPAGFDPNRFVSADAHSAIARFNMRLPGQLMRIAREHRELTGEDLDPDVIISAIEQNAGKKDGVVDPIALWERQYDIPAKRAARATEQRNSELKAAEDRGYERARTEQALQPASVPGRHSPVLVRRDAATGQFQSRESVLKRPQPEAGVRNAAAALASHKYRKTG